MYVGKAMHQSLLTYAVRVQLILFLNQNSV